MVDLASKRVFLIDLDDTLINTTESNRFALRRAYKKLASECESNLSEIISEKQFIDDMKKIYANVKDENNKKFFDYDAEVFEIYCNKFLPEDKLKLKHIQHSLAARLFWQFKETKNACLMARDDAFELLNSLKKMGAAVYCITQGKCNYQHTKVMLTDIETRLAGVVVTENKETELSNYVNVKKFPVQITVMIGDRPSDIKAGKNAGVETIRVLCPDRTDDFSASQPDQTYNNLRELTGAIPKV